MLTMNHALLLRKEDHQLLLSYLNGGHSNTAFDRRNAVALKDELKKARLVEKEEFPNDVVGINSMVTVKAEETNQIMEIKLVTPDNANIKEKKVSVMAPLGTALLGFRKGEQVEWHVPSGKKTFTILEVMNAP